MRIYYFTKKQHAISNLAFSRLKVSRFSDLNDPFELLGIELQDKDLRKIFRGIKERINKNNGLLCFSRSWSNPLMWGHYAENHSGICLGFDVPDSEINEAIYSKKLLKIEKEEIVKNPEITNTVLNKLMRTKFHDWKYEKEVRLFVKLDHETIESGNYFYSFSNELVLKEIVLGPLCEIPVEEMKRFVSKAYPEVHIIKARIAFSSFRVIKDIKGTQKYA